MTDTAVENDGYCGWKWRILRL